MFRKLLIALGLLLLCVCGLRAGEGYRALVQKIDLDRKVIVVKSGEKERPIKVGPGVVLQDERGKQIAFKADELKARKFKEGSPVTISVVTTEKGMGCVIRLMDATRSPSAARRR